MLEKKKIIFIGAGLVNLISCYYFLSNSKYYNYDIKIFGNLYDPKSGSMNAKVLFIEEYKKENRYYNEYNNSLLKESSQILKAILPKNLEYYADTCFYLNNIELIKWLIKKLKEYNVEFFSDKIINIDKSNKSVECAKNVFYYDKLIISCGTGIFKLLNTNFLNDNKKDLLKQNLEIITGAWGTIYYKKKQNESQIYYDSEMFYNIHENKLNIQSNKTAKIHKYLDDDDDLKKYLKETEDELLQILENKFNIRNKNIDIKYGFRVASKENKFIIEKANQDILLFTGLFDNGISLSGYLAKKTREFIFE